MVAGPSSTATPEAKAALRKLVQALPETFRAEAEAAASAVVLDPAGWGGTPGPARPTSTSCSERWSTASRCASATPTARAPRPSAPCTRSASSRRARSGTSSPAPTPACARSASAGCAPSSATGDPVVRPADFDLAETWQNVVETMEERARRRAPSCGSTARRSTGCARSSGRAVAVVAELDDGRLEVEIGAPSAGMIAERLAGWGAHVEVVGPEEVRAELAAASARRALGPRPRDRLHAQRRTPARRRCGRTARRRPTTRRPRRRGRGGRASGPGRRGRRGSRRVPRGRAPRRGRRARPPGRRRRTAPRSGRRRSSGSARASAGRRRADDAPPVGRLERRGAGVLGGDRRLQAERPGAVAAAATRASPSAISAASHRERSASASSTCSPPSPRRVPARASVSRISASRPVASVSSGRRACSDRARRTAWSAMSSWRARPDPAVWPIV